MNALQTIGLTMSSREIAALTGKRHDNVATLCRNLRDMGVCPEIKETPYVNEQNGQTYFECQLTMRDSLVLIARISPEFTAQVVDRWQELEAAQGLKIPQTMAQALRLAAEQAEQLEKKNEQLKQQAEQLALAAPKVDFVNCFVDATGLKGIREVGKLLGVGQKEFVAFLQERGILYRLSGRLTPMQQHLDCGRFEVKTGVADNEHAYMSVKFTAKGVNWIAGEWGKFRVMGIAA